MTLRNRLFLSVALAIGLVLPVGLALEYRATENLSREWMQQQSAFVAELLEEKLDEPFEDIEQTAAGRGHTVTWLPANLNLKSDHALSWREAGSPPVEISLHSVLEHLREVPLMGSGYAFVMDTHGTLMASLSSGKSVTVSLPAEFVQSAFDLSGTDRVLRQIEDPLYHRPADLVLLSVARFGLAVGVIFPEEEIARKLSPLLRTVALTSTSLLLVMWLFTYLLARRVTAPLEELTLAVRRTVKGELEFPLMPSNIREVGQLSAAFASMRRDLANYLEQIRQTSAQAARMARELELAAAIQGNADLQGAVGSWTARGSSEPAREVGGDFMDAFPLPDGRLALLVGDVSGKGIPAALHTLLARSGLKLALGATGSPAQALRQANQLLALDNHDSVFVSAVVAVVDPERNELLWARAGHPTPLTANGALVGPNGPPLGLVEDVDYRETVSVMDSDAYLFYTDGFPEAENEAGKFLTVPPMQAALSRHDGIWTLLREHRGAAEPNDDATAIVLRRS